MLSNSIKTLIVIGLSLLFLCLVFATAATAIYALGLDVILLQPTEEPETSVFAITQSASSPTSQETAPPVASLEEDLATTEIVSLPLISRLEFVETATLTPTPTIEATSTVTLPPVAAAACVPPNPRESGIVTHVVDGDTIDVEINGQIYRVRYIGMDTPEPTNQIDLFGVEATAKNSELVEGKMVTLVKDVSETDRYSRLLRYVFVGDLFVNYELVRQGYATVTTYPPDVSCEANYLKAQQLAIAAGAGLWGLPTTTPTFTKSPIPTLTLTPIPQPPAIQPPPPQQPSGCHPSYPSVCLAMDKGDYDCAGGSGNGPNYVQGPITVLPSDPFDLDRDGDGIGCER